MRRNIRKTLILALLALGGMSHANAQAVVFPQEKQPGTAVVSQSENTYELSNLLFKATYTKADGKLSFAGSDGLCLKESADLFKVTLGNGTVVTSSQMTLGKVEMQDLDGNASAVKGAHRFAGKQLTATYTYGNLKLTWRAVLRNGSHYLRTELDITATADQAMTNIIPMLYTLNNTTVQVVGNTRGAVLAGDKIFAGLETPMGQNTVSGSAIQGLWSRATTLKAGKTWNVGAVVGLVADGQARRSFLAYSERERAVPWRPFPLYNSWYELNINRKDNSDPSDNMKTAEATDVVAQWKAKLFEAQGVGVKTFVWDDGWDNYQTWECHSNFSFDQPSATAKQLGAGTGVWLSPVGGYGTSGDQRRSYWSSRGGMELSNEAYYEVFKAAASKFITDYNGNFFKFDGISSQSIATGPDTDATGEEDAEGIISMERDMRTLKEDLFLNTTVGTWASPFWYQFTDATWRQENDYGTLGKNSSDRENWITYRDQLVYKHYVQNSPLCPINTLMTHGFILADYYTEEGMLWWKEKKYVASTDWSYDAVLREMRCAFACGSGMVELYCDYDLMNSIKNGSGTAGALWSDLAECIRWQQDNADVLPDIHWVGGCPYDGSAHNIYGWASWNGKKATLALRNGGTSAQSYTTTLREVLEIPEYVTGVSITLSKSFSHSQADLSGLPTGSAIDIDTQFTVTLPASSVYVFDGQQFPETTFEAVEEEPEPEPEPEPVVVATPVINPNGGEVEAGSTVTLTCATENATIHYTLDGTEPTAQSAKYEAPVAITKACTLKAVAVKEGNYTDSQVATAQFTVKAKEVVATPVISPNGGEFETSATVTLTCGTDDAQIYYTLDGTTPTTASAAYSQPFTLTESATVKAVAVKSGYYTDSQVTSAVFTITQPEPEPDPEPEPEPEEPTNACGDYLTWEYAGGVLTIGGEGDMYDFASAQDAPWASVAAQVTSIVLPDEITRIGDNAFAGCSGVASLTFDDNDCVFGTNAFASKTKTYLVIDDAEKKDFAMHANKYSKITIKRKLNSTNYGTIIMPFSPSTQTRNAFKFYQLSRIFGNYIYYSRVYTPSANVPYLYKNYYSSSSKWADEVSSVNNETIKATEEPERTTGQWTIIGTYKNLYIDDAERLSYSYVMSNNEIMNSTSSLTLVPFRAYFEGPVYSSDARQMRLVILDDEETTSIYIVQGDEQEETKAYDLQGRRVKKLVPGQMYIINGEKVLFER